MGKQRNCSIDIFRYVCAIFVVAAHAVVFSDFHSGLEFVCVQILPRICIPFFCLTAGYFYTKKLDSGKPCFFPYIKRLFITYFFWSVIYFIVQTLRNPPANFIKSALVFGFRAVTTGSAYHFWFFPALFFAVIFTTLLFKIRCKKLLLPLAGIVFIIGCLGCSYYEIGMQIPFLNKLFAFSQFEAIRRIFMLGFPFFAAGYFVHLAEKKIQDLSKENAWFLWACSVLLWIVEIGAVTLLEWQQNLVLTFALMPFGITTFILLLKYPFHKKIEEARACQVGANFTYYIHPLILLLFSGLPPTLKFAATVIVCGALAFGIYKWDNKIVNYFV